MCRVCVYSTEINRMKKPRLLSTTRQTKTRMRVILCVKTCKVKVINAFTKPTISFRRNNKITLTLSNWVFINKSCLQPGESGFVLLGDLTVETSTDPEPDDSWICDPPSPCDVQFKNANVVINGKSSLRDKSRGDPKVCRKHFFLFSF